VLEVAEEPAGASLSNPWPNPARNSLSVRLALPRAGRVEVDALDLAGRRVRSIVAGELPAGSTTCLWDLRDGRGRRVPAGLYVLRARTPQGTIARRTMVTR